LDARFWKGRRVLVTGHTGFKGSWLCLWLAEMGAEVTGFALAPPTVPSLYEQASVERDVLSVEGDVTDGDAVRRVVGDSRPELVFHLAAQPIVRRSLVDPLGTYATNVMGTVNVLEAVRLAGAVRAVVNVTTDKCYEEHELGRGYRESDPLGGSDPYSSSKAASELVTAAYRRSMLDSQGAPRLATARAGNVIGGGDWGEDRLVPDLVRAALEGRVLGVRNPDAVRPWQHVLNALRGYVELAEALCRSPAPAGAWNFGPGDDDARPVRDVVDRFCELWGADLRWELDSLGHPREAPQLALDSSAARRELGWAPLWGIERGLAAVVEWHRAVAGGADAREVSLAQLSAYAESGRREPAAGELAGGELATAAPSTTAAGRSERRGA
jgi:CDP-glucose 4,6-dehydratase